MKKKLENNFGELIRCVQIERKKFVRMKIERVDKASGEKQYKCCLSGIIQK
jgi:hypothetical protein